jgi:autotransporter-associated beta strand protein
LGNSATEGALDYRGDEDVVCTTRPILLNGAGRLVNSSNADFVFSGVSSAAGVSGSLTLDGNDKSSHNLIENVTDGDGVTSIVKDGDGIWELGNSSARDFSGDLTVKRGVLKVSNRYSWYKWTIRRNDGALNNDNKLESLIQAYAFSLYDQSGDRQNWELKEVSSAASLKPGQVALDAVCTVANYNSTTRLTNLFTRAISRWTCKPMKNNSPIVVEPDDPSTHVSVVMRLPVSASPITSYDWGYSNENPRRKVKSYTLFGSVDGVDWIELHKVDGIEKVNDKYWFFAGGIATMDNISPHTGGQAIDSGKVSRLNATVSVAAGATLESTGAKLEVSKIRIDANGAGVMRNLSFSANGEIDVLNHSDGLRFLPGTYEDCEGLENLENYSLSMNGVPYRRGHVKVLDGKVAVLKPGFVVFVK